MKVIVTGHTSGVGKEIYDYFTNKGCECIGFARSNGYDISTNESRNRIVENAIDADIFVNNVHDSQIDMLSLVCDSWKDSNKIIINISSRASDLVGIEQYPQQEYAQAKKRLDDFVLSQLYGPWIINLKPGALDTQNNTTDWPKMNVNVLSKILDFILENRKEFRVRSITFTI